jgi:hypothetical protein
VKATEWLNELYIHSNLDFCGLYLVGEVPPREHSPDFTNSSKRVDRRSWIGEPNGTGRHRGVLVDMIPQGWGINFWYVGYSVTGNEPAPSRMTSNNAADFGRRHGRHIKKLIYERGPEFAGSTVMVDNEDDDKTPLGPILTPYYNAMFDEMRTPGPGDWQAVRPGLYAHRLQQSELLPLHPDLFVWVVQVDYRWNTSRDMPEPFEQFNVAPASARTAGNPITNPRATGAAMAVTRVEHRKRTDQAVIPEPPWHAQARPADFVPAPPEENVSLHLHLLDIRGLRVTGQRSAIPLGAQMIFYPKQPLPSQPLSKQRTSRCTLPNLQPVVDWDLDATFVRDPRFPIAGPRILVSPVSRFCGFYSKQTLSMAVFEKRGTRTLPVTARDARMIEPEAPLLGISSTEILTIDSSGNLILPVFAGSPPQWTAFRPIPNADPGPAVLPLRRLRALAVTARTADDIHVVYISTSHQIVARRRFRGTWSEPTFFADGTKAHSFSSISCTHRGSNSVDVFFIDSNGLLHYAWWTFDATKPTAWPSRTHQPLQLATSSRLLPGSAIVSISPSSDDLLVFAIGRDLHLHMRVLNTSTGWVGNETRPLGEANHILFAHSRLAVTMASVTVVRVAALSDRGVPYVYTINRDQSGHWMAARSRMELEHRAGPLRLTGVSAARAANAPDAEAVTFDINPYGDVALETFDGQLNIFVAGVRGGELALLRKEVDTTSPWRRERFERSILTSA